MPKGIHGPVPSPCHPDRPMHAKQMCYPCYRREWRKTSDSDRKYQLRTKYGITLDEYAALSAQQGGACAVCRVVDTELVVDHDHTTGRVRGLLCHSCNLGIGKLGDTVAAVQSALDYLKGSEWQRET